MTLSAVVLFAFQVASCGTRSAAAPPSNFVFFGRDHERVSDSAFLSHPAIVGAQLKYTWREQLVAAQRFANYAGRPYAVAPDGQRFLIKIPSSEHSAHSIRVILNDPSERGAPR